MIYNRLNRQLLIRIFVAVILIVTLGVIFHFRNGMPGYFSTRCLDYRQKDFSRKLNDRIVDYSSAAKLKGIGICSNEKEVRKRISEGRLVRVRSGGKYVVDRMTYSYPCITPDSKVLLDEIADRFREKTSQKGLKGSRFYITSMTRKADNLKSLRRHNMNSSVNSPHLYGNAFDISYKRFSARKMVLTNCDNKFMKEALAEVIWQLRDEHKCWATYERMQNCYHIVAR